MPSNETKSTDAKLTASVRLMLGEVSIEAFTEALSKQTGLMITAAPSLRERTVFARMENLSASTALDAIAEIHDWTWREIEPGHILLARRVLNVPQEPAFIPRLIQNALPADLREYLHVSRPTENRREYRDPDTRTTDLISANERLTASAFGALHDLRATLSIDNLTKANLPYSKLTADQKKHLLTFYVYDGLGSLRALLLADLPRMYQDPASSVIHFDEKSSNFQGTGFGAYIKPLGEK